MVYFTCDACGEQLKKPSVEKHYTQKCRDCYKLTCIDCLKDFFGDDYKSHNACMSEDQRYSKEGRAGWDPSQGSGHKGEKKQNAWVNNLRKILAETTNIDSDVKTIVNTILDHENIPRKKPKFTNFVKNIMRNRASAHSIDKTWELFSQALAPAPPPPEKTEEVKKMDVDTKEPSPEPASKKEKKKKKKDDDKAQDSENNVKEKKAKKRKRETVEEEEKENSDQKPKKKKKHNKEKNEKFESEESMETDSVEDEPPAAKKTKFNWEETIEELLKKNDGSMKLKKMKKKCVNELLSLEKSKPITPEEASAKFDKKIKKMSKFKVLNDRISLKEDSTKVEEEKAVEESKPLEHKPKASESEGSFNNWESANLGSASQNEKFRRLMGIKNPGKDGAGKFGGVGRNDKKIFNDLEKGFEKARQMHFGGRCFES